MEGVDPLTNQAYGSYMYVDYSVRCDTLPHRMYQLLAWLLLGLMAVGFPVGLGWHLRSLNARGLLWIAASRSDDGAVRCEYTNAWLRPHPDAARDLGFLFLTYEPRWYWWEVRGIATLFVDDADSLPLASTPCRAVPLVAFALFNPRPLTRSPLLCMGYGQVKELVKKLFLTGVIMLILPGTPEQA